MTAIAPEMSASSGSARFNPQVQQQPSINSGPSMQTFATTSMVGPAFGRNFGRQEFEDAQFAAQTKEKLKILNHVMEREGDYDIIFGFLIIVNMIVIGWETESAPITKYDPITDSPFFWIEVFFLVAFTIELVLRYIDWRRKTDEAEVQAALEAAPNNAALSTASALAASGKSLHRQNANVMRLASGADLGASVGNPGQGMSGSGTLKGFTSMLTMPQKKARTFGTAVIETLSNFYENRFRPKLSCALSHGWTLFDAVIVVCSLLDLIVLMDGHESAGVGVLRLLRIMRVFRTVKLLRYCKSLWLLFHGLIAACRTIMWIASLLLFLIYASAIFLTRLIGHDKTLYNKGGLDDKGEPLIKKYFGTLGDSMYTLFIVLTLEEWPQRAQPVVDAVGPGMAIFFVCYIIVTNFTVLNLVVGVICENIQSLASTSDLDLMRQVTQDRRVMQEKLLEVFCELDIDKNGELTKEELAQSLNDSQIKDILLKNEIQDEELHWLFEVLDRDGSETLTIEEFVNGVMALKSSEQARDLVSMQYTLVKEFNTLSKAHEQKVDELETEVQSLKQQLYARMDSSVQLGIAQAVKDLVGMSKAGAALAAGGGGVGLGIPVGGAGAGVAGGAAATPGTTAAGFAFAPALPGEQARRPGLGGGVPSTRSTTMEQLAGRTEAAASGGSGSSSRITQNPTTSRTTSTTSEEHQQQQLTTAAEVGAEAAPASSGSIAASIKQKIVQHQTFQSSPTCNSVASNSGSPITRHPSEEGPPGGVTQSAATGQHDQPALAGSTLNASSSNAGSSAAPPRGQELHQAPLSRGATGELILAPMLEHQQTEGFSGSGGGAGLVSELVAGGGLGGVASSGGAGANPFGYHSTLSGGISSHIGGGNLVNPGAAAGTSNSKLASPTIRVRPQQHQTSGGDHGGGGNSGTTFSSSSAASRPQSTDGGTKTTFLKPSTTTAANPSAVHGAAGASSSFSSSRSASRRESPTRTQHHPPPAAYDVAQNIHNSPSSPSVAEQSVGSPSPVMGLSSLGTKKRAASPMPTRPTGARK